FSVFAYVFNVGPPRDQPLIHRRHPAHRLLFLQALVNWIRIGLKSRFANALSKSCALYREQGSLALLSAIWDAIYSTASDHRLISLDATQAPLQQRVTRYSSAAALANKGQELLENMMNLLQPTALALLTATLLLTSAASADEKSPERERKVDQIFAPYDKPDSPGCALGVVRDGQFIYKRGYGAASLELGVPLT